MTKIDELIKKTDSGDFAAMAQAGSYLVWGKGFTAPVKPEMFSKSLQYLIKAAAAGYDDAMMNLGSIYMMGFGVEEDDNEAVKWYTAAANRGNQDAMVTLGGFYLHNKEKAVDYHKAFQLFSKAALLKANPALLEVGSVLMAENYAGKDFKLGFLCYRQAYKTLVKDKREDLYPDACFGLGTNYYHGKGTAVSLTEAQYYLNEAVTYYKKGIATQCVADDYIYYLQAVKELNEVNKLLASQ